MKLNLDLVGNYNIPPVGSRHWKSATQPLLAFIEKGDRSVAEIVAWGRERGHMDMLTRHMLAWLSYSGLVYYVVPSDAWRVGPEPAGIAETWVKLDRRSPRSRRLMDPVPQGSRSGEIRDPLDEEKDHDPSGSLEYLQGGVISG